MDRRRRPPGWRRRSTAPDPGRAGHRAARTTSHPGRPAAASAAAWSPSRVLPVPPGPVSVTRRTAGSRTRATIASELRFPADERRRLDRQVRRQRVEPACRRKVDREARRNELEEGLAGPKVGQSMLAKLANIDLVEGRLSEEVPGRARQDDLPRVREVGEPRGLLGRRRPGVQPDLQGRAARRAARWIAAAAAAASRALVNAKTVPRRAGASTAPWAVGMSASNAAGTASDLPSPASPAGPSPTGAGCTARNVAGPPRAPSPPSVPRSRLRRGAPDPARAPGARAAAVPGPAPRRARC